MTKKRDYAVVVSIISAIISLTCIGIICFHNFDQNGVVELGTFIGIGVALIGICATIIVALQIINFIEFKEVKNRIQNIDIIEKEIIASRDRIENFNMDFANILFDLARFNEDKSLKIEWILKGIVIGFKTCDLSIDKNIDAVFVRYEKLLEELDHYEQLKIFDETWVEFISIKIPKLKFDNSEISEMHRKAIIKISTLMTLQ